MNFENFFEEADRLKVQLSSELDQNTPAAGLSNEALFQLPLLAMTILLLAKGKNKPNLEQVGQLVGECIERSIPGFKGSSQDIGWSANLRIRTVRALTFLEEAGLVFLSQAKAISVTERGRKVIDTALSDESRLSLALFTLERNYMNIEAESRLQDRLL